MGLRFWLKLPLFLLGAVALGAGAVLAGAAVVGSATVRVENQSCGTVNLARVSAITRAANLLPFLEVPSGSLSPGSSALIRVPSGDYEVEVASDSARVRWFRFTASGRYGPPPLRSAQWEGRELVGRGPQALHLAKGGYYTLRIACAR
jgi:hypothetical protein